MNTLFLPEIEVGSYTRVYGVSYLENLEESFKGFIQELRENISQLNSEDIEEELIRLEQEVAVKEKEFFDNRITEKDLLESAINDEVNRTGEPGMVLMSYRGHYQKRTERIKGYIRRINTHLKSIDRNGVENEKSNTCESIYIKGIESQHLWSIAHAINEVLDKNKFDVPRKHLVRIICQTFISDEKQNKNFSINTVYNSKRDKQLSGTLKPRDEHLVVLKMDEVIEILNDVLFSLNTQKSHYIKGEIDYPYTSVK